MWLARLKPRATAPCASRCGRYFVTVTVTFSYVKIDPSLATARSTYVPGSEKVARVFHLPSAGGSGIV